MNEWMILLSKHYWLDCDAVLGWFVICEWMQPIALLGQPVHVVMFVRFVLFEVKIWGQQYCDKYILINISLILILSLEWDCDCALRQFHELRVSLHFICY